MTSVCVDPSGNVPPVTTISEAFDGWIMPVNKLYYGDNLELLRNPKYIRDCEVDLCYIDPPFNSKRCYNQIYNNQGREDRAQAQAFIDIHSWNDQALDCYKQIITNEGARYTAQTIELVKGLRAVLGEGSLLAYLVSMTARIAEIYRVLKPQGSFFLHCDPTASHYLKIITDSVFCGRGGNFVNEIAWCYSHGGKSKKHFGKKHDVIFWYSKSANYFFNGDAVRIPMKSGATSFGGRLETDENGRKYRLVYGTKNKDGKTRYYKYYLDVGKIPEDYWTDINSLQSGVAERLGYPTQKPEALLERIIKATTAEGDVVLDCYCGCGTTVAVAQKLKRSWIGMDITYQAIATIISRFEEQFPDFDSRNIVQDGIPIDMASARALANKRDDRVRKEFEKWAILTYCNHKAIINEKKGADHGIDGLTYILGGPTESIRMVLQAKSGHVGRGDVAKLRGDMGDAALATLITLEKPSKPMLEKAKSAGKYFHTLTGRNVDRIRIVTVEEILEKRVRLDLPQSLEDFKAVLRSQDDRQMKLNLDGDERKEPSSEKRAAKTGRALSTRK